MLQCLLILPVAIGRQPFKDSNNVVIEISHAPVKDDSLVHVLPNSEVRSHEN